MFKQTIQIFGRIKPTNKTAAVRAQFSAFRCMSDVWKIEVIWC